MKPKTMNLKAVFVEFERDGTSECIAKVLTETPNRKRVRVNIRFNFSCLPYILPRLSKEWQQARQYKVSEIERIDRVLPS